MNKSEEYYERKKEAIELYATFKHTKSPALGENFVHFTSEGFNHLVYKGSGKERDPRVQIMRFELLNKAKFILDVSTTFQEYEESYENMRIQKMGKKINVNKPVRHWGFLAIIKGFRVKVVVRQIGEGKKEFYSVIPAWTLRRYHDIKIIDMSTGEGLATDDDIEILKNATPN